MVCPCCCAGACPNGNECSPGCVCVNGQCVPPPPQTPCPCFTDGWPSSFTASFCGLRTNTDLSQCVGLCGCPAGDIGGGFSKTVILDFAGEANATSCPVQFANTTRVSGTFNIFFSNSNSGAKALGIYRGVLSNDNCPAYGVELVVYKINSLLGCQARMTLAPLSGESSICESWVSWSCYSWSFGGSLTQNCVNSTFGASSNLGLAGSRCGSMDSAATCALVADV